MKRIKRLFTLLEVMIGMVLLVIVSSVIGLKMHEAVCKKHFQSDLERLKAHLLMAQKMAVAMQADWSGLLKKEGKEWVFQVFCDEEKVKNLRPLRFKSMEVFFDGKIANGLAVDFFSSGRVSPEGTFLFTYKQEKAEWKTVEFFQQEEGEKLGAAHPDD